MERMITIETMDGNIIEGEVIDLAELNKMARKCCLGLTYLMNVMAVDSVNGTDCYMWFKDDRTGNSYLVGINN